MPRLDLLTRDGVVSILRRLCTGESRFKELNKNVTNTRTLTRRLMELQAGGLILKAGARYRITKEGWEIAFKIAELEGKSRYKRVNLEELTKISPAWVRVSIGRLAELLLEEFNRELISIVVYGSTVKGSFKISESDIDLLYVLEDDTDDVWKREEKVFRNFRSKWEYRACDYWLREIGFYGYPEITTVWLRRSCAKSFQPVYLDMLRHSAILYDNGNFFQKLMERLEEALMDLRAVRVEHPDGKYGWILKPDMTPGELIEIGLE